MTIKPVNNQIAIFLGNCCNEAHALYLDQLSAAGESVRMLAVITPEHPRYSELAIEIDKSVFKYTSKLSTLADIVATENMKKIKPWAEATSKEVEELKLKGIETETAMADVETKEGVITVQLGMLETGPSTSEVTKPSPHSLVIAPYSSANPTPQDALQHYQAETVRIHLAMDIESHQVDLANSTRIAELESQVNSLIASVAALQKLS